MFFWKPEQGLCPHKPFCLVCEDTSLGTILKATLYIALFLFQTCKSLLWTNKTKIGNSLSVLLINKSSFTV
jgi:hypothetical protein